MASVSAFLPRWGWSRELHATAAVLVCVTLAYLAGMGVLVGRSSSAPALCPECGRMGRVHADDEEDTVRHRFRLDVSRG